ncbi:MAG: hypothetical protein JXR97_15415 [Planctomycetes bacterium]|nr:hypothetical protein [Planctomycetota bacterium]
MMNEEYETIRPCGKQRVLYACFCFIMLAAATGGVLYWKTLYTKWLIYTLKDDPIFIHGSSLETYFETPFDLSKSDIIKTPYWNLPQWEKLEALGENAVPDLVKLIEEDDDYSRSLYIISKVKCKESAACLEDYLVRYSFTDQLADWTFTDNAIATDGMLGLDPEWGIDYMINNINDYLDIVYSRDIIINEPLNAITSADRLGKLKCEKAIPALVSGTRPDFQSRLGNTCCIQISENKLRPFAVKALSEILGKPFEGELRKELEKKYWDKKTWETKYLKEK